MGNSVLGKAKIAKQDEYYTRLADIEQEMVYYRDHLFGKTIFLNCDDPEYSNFWQYFSLNYDFLGLKGLISTHYEYEEGKSSYMLRYESISGNNKHKTIKKELKGNGDFRSDECIELLKESDIVITNPPFSIWREYLAQLVKYDKKFIIIGNKNAVTYKEVFPLLQDDKIWIGQRPMNRDFWFIVPEEYEHEKLDEYGNRVKHIMGCWYTNLDIPKRHEDLVLTEFYEGNEDYYPKYDNYEAINVNIVKEIPMDYPGIMGVPITFLNNYNPDQFDIVGMTTGRCEFEKEGWPSKRYENAIQHNKNGTTTSGSKANTRATILLNEKPNDIYYTADNADGPLKIMYARILIRNKKSISRKELLGF